ncbi:MAG: SCP2 sterol-binding domain-containing protein [Thermoplasmata archaeon]
MKFGSSEYLQKVKEITNSDEKYANMVKEYNLSYTFIIEAEPNKGVSNEIIIGYKMKDGKMEDIWEGVRETDFVISGKYSVWVDLLTGKMGLTLAFLQRKLKIRGEFSKILQLSKATEYWIQMLKKIPTEFEGEFSKYNIGGE